MPTEVKQLRDNNLSVRANVDYSLVSSETFWTKNAGANGYNAGIISKDAIITAYNDQSIRFRMGDITKRIRAGFSQYPSPLGGNPLLAWELIPAIISAPNVIFQDDFSGGSLDLDKWEYYNGLTSGETSFSGGKLTISTNAGKGVGTKTALDFNNKSASAKVEVITSDSDMINGILIATPSTFWAMEEANGLLRCGNEMSTVYTEAYNATNHAYLKIRFAGNGVFFEASPDGINWKTIFSAVSTASKANAKFYLLPYMTTSHSVAYDNAKITEESVFFGDDFGLEVVDGKWGSPFNCSASVVGGELALATNNGANYLPSKVYFNPVGKSLSFKPTIGASGNYYDLILMENDGGAFWGIQIQANKLRWIVNSNPAIEIDYNPAIHVYVKYVFIGANIEGFYSTDGVNWTSVGTAANSGSYNTNLRLWAYHYNVGSSETVKFDDIRLETPSALGFYRVIVNNSVVFTSTRTPSNGNELRIQLVYESSTLKLYFKWREENGEPEELEYTSTLDTATLEALFPLFCKGEFYEIGSKIENLQIEGNNWGGLQSKLGFVNENFLSSIKSLNSQITGGGENTMQFIFKGANLNAPTPGLSYFRASGQPIKTIRIWTSQANNFGDTIFNVKLAGTDLFTGESKPKILQGQNFVELAGLNLPTVKGDVIQLVLETAPATGVVYTPITFEVLY